MIDEILGKIMVVCAIHSIYGAIALAVSTYLLAYAVPPHIVTKYFRQPHFNDGDDQLFEHFPFRYYLTLWIAQFTAWDWFARRRKAYDLRKDSPKYWRVLSWIYIWIIVIPPIVSFLIAGLILIYLNHSSSEIQAS